MKKGKTTRSRQDARARYTWHLRPPFDKEFDRKHWWDGLLDDEIKPVAALYELARRHPSVGEALLKKELQPDCDYPAVACLRRVGLKSWPKLEASEMESWEDCAGKIKGLDCRSELEQCDSVTLSGYSDVLIKRLAALKGKTKGMTFEDVKKLVAKQWVKDPPRSVEIEQFVMLEARAAEIGRGPALERL